MLTRDDTLRRLIVQEVTVPEGLSSRGSQRFPVTYPVIFGGAPFVGEGVLVNLAVTGCSVSCDRTVLAGSYIRLNVFLPDHTASLRVELGKVRWVRDDTFGVEFIRLPTIARQRLDRMVWDRLAQLPKAESAALDNPREWIDQPR